MFDIKEVYKAKERLKAVIKPAPLARATRLSAIAKSEIYLKKENLLLTGSFKIRGAFNKIAALMEEAGADSGVDSKNEKSKMDSKIADSKNLNADSNTDSKRPSKPNGVIAASAGNHAQGVAFSASHFNIPSIIVMPEATPLLKVSATRELGAQVVLKGDNYDEAYAHALSLAREQNLAFIHPFADPLVIAGQGSIALEMIEDMPELDTIIVPIGGGGLIAGIASVYKVLKPSVRIVGVVAAGANAMLKSFSAGTIKKVDSVKTLADGIAVRDVNELNFEIIKNCVDEMVEVDDEEIARAILYLIERQKLVVEGAGAASVAAILHEKVRLKNGEKTALILSGGNIDITLLNVIIEKGLVKSDRKIHLDIVLIDKPGSLERLSNALSAVGANIVQVGYDRTPTGYGDALISIALELRGKEHKEQVFENLTKNGFSFKERK